MRPLRGATTEGSSGVIARRGFLGLGLGAACGWLCGIRPARGGQLPACLSSGGHRKRIDVDVHCHVFNGTDLQVSRFLSKVAYREFPQTLQPLVVAMGPLLEEAAWEFAPRASEEKQRLAKFGSGSDVQKSSDASFEQAAEADLLDGTQRYIEGLSKHLKTAAGQLFYDEYGKYVRALAQTVPRATGALVRLVPRLEELATAEVLRAKLAEEKETSGPRIFSFMHNFFQYRYVNAYRALKTYGCDHGQIQVIAPAMVDYDYPLGAENHHLPSPLPEQMEVMERVAILFQGRVLPYAPFDPWRVAAGDRSVISAARDSVDRGGLVGIKIYPPMGFAPYGNVTLATPPNQRPSAWPSDPDFPSRLDKALAELWTWCADPARQIPVLAHSSPSNYSAVEFKEIGGPARWADALQHFPGLRVCFGHSGGQELLEGPWTRDFAQLEQKYPGAYSDGSYFSAVLNEGTRRSLATRVGRLLDEKPAADKRLMYGSDWIMLSIEGHSDLYYEKFAAALASASVPAAVVDQIFSTNAIDFLGLKRGQPTRQRLERFYATNHITPVWEDAASL